MDEFIQSVIRQLGISEEQGRTATAGVLKVIREKLDDSSFSNLMDQLPGAQGLVRQADAAPQGLSSGGGGLLGSLTSMAGSLLGGSDSMAAQVTKTLAESGLGIDKVAGFIGMLVSYLKEKLGAEAFESLAKQLPDLIGRNK